MKEFLILGLVLVNSFVLVENCNEAVCASVVSKCLLTQDCSCDNKNYSCSASCSSCLGKLFMQCCTCVDICPQVNEEVLDTQSTVEDIDEPVPGLFNAIAESEDAMLWTTETFESSYKSSKGGMISVNCSVIWWKQCLNYQKCKENCISLGASSIRMFHDGCCECVGDTCIRYGRKQSGCQHCPFDGDSNAYPLEPDEENFDYGEDSEMDDVKKIDDFI